MDASLDAGAGVAVGGLVCRKRVVQTVIKALDERQWRKKRVKVSAYDEERMVVAVVPEGARALDAHSERVPSTLADLMQAGDVAWISGLRAGAAEATKGSTAAEGTAEPAFRFAELFAGMGGFRLGLDPLGGRCVFASEIDPFAAATYERNFGEAPFGDIVEVPTEAVPAHDVLTAGFPCQSFSRAGEQRGLQDDRGDLFFEIVRLARARRPRALLLENVPNLLRVDNGHALHIIISELTAAGYHVRAQLLNAAALVPQHRERLFLVGFRDAAAAAAFQWPAFAAAPAGRPAPLRAALQPLDAAELPRYRLSATQWAQARDLGPPHAPSALGCPAPTVPPCALRQPTSHHRPALATSLTGSSHARVPHRPAVAARPARGAGAHAARLLPQVSWVENPPPGPAPDGAS
jgi:site-specific DNA-cytosine methylase